MTLEERNIIAFEEWLRSNPNAFWNGKVHRGGMIWIWMFKAFEAGQANGQEPQYLTADQLTEPGYYWWLPTSMADQAQLAEFWHIRAWDSRDSFRERSGLFIGPLKAPVRLRSQR